MTVHTAVRDGDAGSDFSSLDEHMGQHAARFVQMKPLSRSMTSMMRSMHRSRLRAVLIDVPDETFTEEAGFWAGALGRPLSRPPGDADPYLGLMPADQGVRISLQRIDGPARVHVDIETDDVDAEVSRLEGLGARRAWAVEDWVTMRDPAGLLFCVIPVDSSDFPDGAMTWE